VGAAKSSGAGHGGRRCKRAGFRVGFLRGLWGTEMKLAPIIVAVGIVLPIAPVMAVEGPNRDTAALEAQYKACLTQARDLQKRYSDCKSKQCTDAVTADFEAWSAKCFKE